MNKSQFANQKGKDEMIYKYNETVSAKAVSDLRESVGWNRMEDVYENPLMTSYYHIIKCTGCHSHKQCTYQLVDCTQEHGVEKCNQCSCFPCDKISKMLLQSQEYQKVCKEVCTLQEYEKLEEAFFNKEKYLGM